MTHSGTLGALRAHGSFISEWCSPVRDSLPHVGTLNGAGCNAPCHWFCSPLSLTRAGVSRRAGAGAGPSGTSRSVATRSPALVQNRAPVNRLRARPREKTLLLLGAWKIPGRSPSGDSNRTYRQAIDTHPAGPAPVDVAHKCQLACLARLAQAQIKRIDRSVDLTGHPSSLREVPRLACQASKWHHSLPFDLQMASRLACLWWSEAIHRCVALRSPMPAALLAAE